MNIELSLSLREKYKVVRKQKGIKLRHISKEIGVSVPMLSMYENELANLNKEKENKYRLIIMRNDINL
ncbi:helix-turn-helix transcriptional regulator [Bacillus sp. RG28]|uniref:Helix-turn-helix transcriptional regulator n=1 Tax=Gottfriedia endophytica TaxID=2820819 RepID=A0A940NUP9_9BACI|nr:helix-turn-helix transcriptional regulator [Gottfriedia endophytica]MBP0725203.1 helix-turn-helix transcriptional regulator [Gottfriedia endophytica]